MFTVVSPVHNEENMLPLTLGNLYALNPDQVLFGVDRCTDRTEEMIQREAERHPDSDTVIRRFSDGDGREWRFRGAYLRRTLYRESRNDVILNTSADIQLCGSIAKHLNLIPEYALVSFHYYEKPWNIQCFERAIITRWFPGFAGLLAFSRDAWLDTEDLEDLKTIRRGEDTHLQLAIRKKYPVRHIHTRSIHLRPNETKMDHYLRGHARFMQRDKGWAKNLIHSVIMLRPALFTGYMHARHGVRV